MCLSFPSTAIQHHLPGTPADKHTNALSQVCCAIATSNATTYSKKAKSENPSASHSLSAQTAFERCRSKEPTHGQTKRVQQCQEQTKGFVDALLQFSNKLGKRTGEDQRAQTQSWRPQPERLHHHAVPIAMWFFFSAIVGAHIEQITYVELRTMRTPTGVPKFVTVESAPRGVLKGCWAK